MKKFYSFFLICATTLALAACASKSGDTSSAAANGSGESTVAQESQASGNSTGNSSGNSSGNSTGNSSGNSSLASQAATESTTAAAQKASYTIGTMISGFSGGIAWARIKDDTGVSRNALINKDLQVVYLLPDNTDTGDCYNGRAVVINSDQTSNPGFSIIGSDGKTLYNSSERLKNNGSSYVSLTKDGGVVYYQLESGLTTNGTHICVLNSKYEAIASLDAPASFDYDSCYYISEGVYYSDPYVINTKTNSVYSVSAAKGKSTTYNSTVAFSYTKGDYTYYIEADKIDYSIATDVNTFVEQICASDKCSGKLESGSLVDYSFSSGNYCQIQYSYYNGKNKSNGYKYESVAGITIPDFGVAADSYSVSSDGKYVAVKLKGADGNSYFTVIGSDGKSLYEPVTASINNYAVFSGGYIISNSGNGITADGKTFKLGDGTDLSSIGNDSYYTTSNITISEGYIVYDSKLYKLNGIQVTAVTM